MKSFSTNFLHSGHLFLNNEEYTKYKFIFLNNVIGFATFITFFIGLYRFHQHNISMSIIDISFSFIAIFLLYRLRKNKKSIEQIATILLTLSFLLFVAVFVLAPIQSTRLALFFLLGASAFFLKGSKIGLYWLLLSALTISAIHFGKLVNTHYTNADVLIAFVYLAAFYCILNVYESIKNAQRNHLLHMNENLENLVIARTLELEKEKELLQAMSSEDSLTGLYNRRKIEESFEYVKKQSERYKTDLSIVLMDLDLFKSVNDSHGHNVGDIFLKEIADVLKKSLREADIIGRWGGEEFIVLLPKTGLNDAKELIERVRKIIEATEFTDIGKRTASFGIAALDKDESLPILISRADKALYSAKEKGRNRVEIMDTSN